MAAPTRLLTFVTLLPGRFAFFDFAFAASFAATLRYRRLARPEKASRSRWSMPSCRKVAR